MNDTSKEFLFKLASLLGEYDADLEMENDTSNGWQQIILTTNKSKPSGGLKDYINLGAYCDLGTIMKLVN